MNKYALLAAAAALTAMAPPAFAQNTTGQSQTDRIGSIFGALFGDRLGTTTSLEAQWAAGRSPLAAQRNQFDTRVDAEIRTGNLTQSVGSRIKSDYVSLIELEARYGADQRFTSQERTDLADRYGALTQVLADRGYPNGGYTGNSTTNGGYTYGGSQSNETAATPDVANGRADFDSRVTAAVSARRITRVEGTRLKSEYAALVQTEAGYLRDGLISDNEREYLDTRLDALDARIGGSAYASPILTPRARLDAITRALPSSGLSTSARTQLVVEQQDLLRLEAAYTRFNPTADDKAYLERRLSELEVRARIRR